jgi:hypothetical protein
MPEETETLKLLRTLQGLYKPSSEEVYKLAGIAKLNKLYLAYLRRVRDVLRNELTREEARYRWFMRNAAEVVEVLESVGADYALYKFRRPFEHVSVDLDVLARVEDVPEAVRALVSRGFRVAVWEPYTVTLARSGFIVDLYTHPSFAWVVYMDGGRLLECCVEEVEVGGLRAGALSRDAEVVVAAAHAIYKEHLVLLSDCLLLWSWLNREIWGMAVEHGVEYALEVLLKACSLVWEGLTEAPYRPRPHAVLGALTRKLLHDPLLRTTLPSALRYLTRGDLGRRVLARLTRGSY